MKSLKSLSLSIPELVNEIAEDYCPYIMKYSDNSNIRNKSQITISQQKQDFPPHFTVTKLKNNKLSGK